MAKFSKGQTVVHGFHGTGKVIGTGQTPSGKSTATVEFTVIRPTGKKTKQLILEESKLKFPTEVSKPSLAPETETKSAPKPAPAKAKPEPAPEPEAEPEPEVDETLKRRQQYEKRVDEAMAKSKTANDAHLLSLIKSKGEEFTQAMTSKELKEMLKDRGIGSSGNKSQLISRLRRHLEKKTRRGKATPVVTVEAPDWTMPELGAAVSRQSIAKELSGFNKAQLMALAEKAGEDITGSVANLKASLMPPYKHLDKMNLDELKFELASLKVTGGQLTGRKAVLKRLLKKKWAAQGYDERHLKPEHPAGTPATEIMATKLEHEAKTDTPKIAKDKREQAAKIRAAAKKDKTKAATKKKTVKAAAREVEEEEEEPVEMVEPTPKVVKEKPTIVKGKAGYPAWWEKVWAEETAAGKTINPEEFFTTQNMTDFAKKAMLPTGDRTLKGTTIPSDCKNIKYADLSDKGQMWFNKWGRGLCSWLAGATLQVKARQKKYTQLTPEGKAKRETPVETAKQMRACRDMMWELRDALAPSACSYRVKTGQRKKA
jgi:hypothetical protein